MPTAGETWYGRAKWEALKREEYPWAFAEDAIVRYIDLKDTRDLESIVAYVQALTGITVTLSGNAVAGTWNTFAVGYEPVNPAAPKGDMRLWHALIPSESPAPEAARVVENNCTFKVSYTFYWRQATLATPVTAGQSGIEYSIKSPNADPKSGRWNYILEKREQMTTRIASHKVAETDFETVYEQSFYGVRESSAGSGVYTLDHNGGAVALWTVGVATQGTRITQSDTKNANCTADITQRKTVAKAVTDSVRTTGETVFERETSATDANQATAVIAGVTAVDGVVVTRKADVNPDGTFQNTEGRKAELEKLAAEALAAKDQAGTATTVTDRNVATAGAVPVSYTPGTLVEVDNKVTDGGRFIRIIKTTIAALWPQKVVRSAQDAFETTTETHEDAAPASLGEAPAASGGTWWEHLSRKRLDWLFDTQKTQHVERSIAAAAVRRMKTLYAYVTETESVDAVALGDSPAAVGGVVTEHTDSLTRGGKFKRKASVTTAQPVSAAIKRVSRTPFDVTTETVNRNQAAAMADPIVAGVTVKNDKTDGNQLDQTETKVETAGGSGGVVERTRTLWEATRHAVTTWTRNMLIAPLAPSVDETGVVNDVTSTLNSIGKYDAQVERDVAVELNREVTIFDDDGEYTIYLRENNTVASMSAFLLTLNTNRKISASPRISRYPGLIDMTIVSRSVSAAGALESKLTYHYEDKVEHVIRIVRMDDVVYKEDYTVTFDVRRGRGVKEGRVEYDALEPLENWGSSFDDIGRNWYWYKAVKSVSLTTTDVTSTYQAETAISL